MKRLLILSLFAVSAACQSLSTGPVDEDQREELLSLVTALEGEWTCSDPEGNQSSTVFAVSSGGTVVRELMFPGEPHEMTNMYSLDGNDLVMTHYCAGGNQPSMRADGMVGNKLPFHFESVRDLTDPDGHYMGEMTIVFNADGSIEQHWMGLKRGEVDEDHTMVFKLDRR